MRAENKRPIILMVDDDHDQRELARAFFQGMYNYPFMSVATYQEAIEAIRGTVETMVVFIDLDLGRGKNGIDLLRFIYNYATHRVVPYIYTGCQVLALWEIALKDGAKRVFVKGREPLEEVELSCRPEVIAHFLEKKDRDTGLELPLTFERAVFADLEAAYNKSEEGFLSIFSLIMGDMDKLKQLNNVSYSLGTRAICETASQLQSHLRLHTGGRPLDRLGRKGGDEFLIWLPGYSIHDAQAIAGRLDLAVKNSSVFDSSGKEYPLSMTLGVSQVVEREITESIADTYQGLFDRANWKELQGKKRAR